MKSEGAACPNAEKGDEPAGFAGTFEPFFVWWHRRFYHLASFLLARERLDAIVKHTCSSNVRDKDAVWHYYLCLFDFETEHMTGY